MCRIRSIVKGQWLDDLVLGAVDGPTREYGTHETASDLGFQVKVLNLSRCFLFARQRTSTRRYHGLPDSGWGRWMFHLVLGAVDRLALVVERERASISSHRMFLSISFGMLLSRKIVNLSFTITN